MILQIDERFTDDNIKRFGCYFMVILYYVNKIANIPFDPDKIQLIKSTLVSKSLMGNDCYIKDPQGIFDYFGLPVIYMGHEGKAYQTKKAEFEVLCFKRFMGRRSYNHFVGGCNGHVTYDPMGYSKAVKLGQIDSKRIYFVD